MSKRQIALVVSGAVVVAGAAYLWFRARPKKVQEPAEAKAAAGAKAAAEPNKFQERKRVQEPSRVAELETVEELKLKADSGDAAALFRLALLHLNEDQTAGIDHDAPRGLQLLHKAAENGSVEAMM